MAAPRKGPIVTALERSQRIEADITALLTDPKLPSLMRLRIANHLQVFTGLCTSQIFEVGAAVEEARVEATH